MEKLESAGIRPPSFRANKPMDEKTVRHKLTDKLQLSQNPKPRVTHRCWRPTGKREIPFDPGPTKDHQNHPRCGCSHWIGIHENKKGLCAVPGCGCLEVHGGIYDLR